MITEMYSVNITLLLKPIGNPKCLIQLGDQRFDLLINHEQSIDIDFCGHGKHVLEIEHYGKDNLDPTTALIIEDVKLNGISDVKFVYQGVYHPKYPPHLINNSKILPHQNYLSWNGVWQLDFTLPIYTWIHKTLDLGWIYD